MHESAAPLVLKVFRRVVLVVMFVGASGVVAWCQTPGRVRVVNTAKIIRWLPKVPSDTLLTVEPGTDLEVVDRQDDWFWVVTPPDAVGSRRVGWIAARNVEAVVEEPVEKAAVNTPPAMPPRETAPPVTPAAPPVQAAAQPQPAVRPSSALQEGTPPAKSYQFDDVLFDLNRASVRPAGAATLDVAAKALLDDRNLRMTIEGYTCDLGTPVYNLALGERRAEAARDYLVSHGVAAGRLTTVSFGEERPAHDNAQEETRRLNRRVALVPEPANGARASAGQ